MKENRTINAVAVAIAAVAWYGLHLSFHPHPPNIDPRPHEGVGEVLAAEAMRVREPGGRIIVIARASEPFQVPASAAQVDAFLRAVKKLGGTVAVTQKIKADPLRIASVPPGDFFELMRNGRDNDVIVSFLGPPVLSQDQLAKLGKKRPFVLAVCSGAMPAQVDLKGLFEQKLLSAAVVSRNSTLTRLATGDRQKAFDQMFRLITASNVSELPGTGAGRKLN